MKMIFLSLLTTCAIFTADNNNHKSTLQFIPSKPTTFFEEITNENNELIYSCVSQPTCCNIEEMIDGKPTTRFVTNLEARSIFAKYLERYNAEKNQK